MDVSRRVLLAVLALTVWATPAVAQRRPVVGVRGFATLGSLTFQAKESFETVLGSASGVVFGGGGQVLLPWDIYVEVAASRFRQQGERVFVGPNDEVFRLGIPVEVTVMPLELTGGFRYRKWRRAVPYGGIGYSFYRYRETSEFADRSENVNDGFGGFHLVGGAEIQPKRWLAVGGEVSWSSIPDALGDGGVSAAFDEHNLGGSTFRIKVSVGR
ncbi:MAG: hypothetical protein H0T71_02315 [Acidobacteria bacterium]|nr:hypothetical protein [Acidobacteriota bacterium]